MWISAVTATGCSLLAVEIQISIYLVSEKNIYLPLTTFKDAWKTKINTHWLLTYKTFGNMTEVEMWEASIGNLC